MWNIKDLEGKTENALALFRSLPTGYDGHLVRNGVLDFEEANPSTADRFDFDLILEACHLRNPHPTRRPFAATHFSRSFTICHSTIDHDFVFERCIFGDDFRFDNVELRGTLQLLCCTFLRGLPIFRRVRAQEKVSCLGINGTHSTAMSFQRFQFDSCRFYGGVEIEVPSIPVNLVFSDSVFEQGSSSRISWSSAGTAEVHFSSCLLAGRVFLNDAMRNAAVTLQIHGSSITGELNLENVVIEKLSLPDSSLSGGMLAMQVDQLTPAETGRFRFVPGMRLGIIADEKHLALRNAIQTSTETPVPGIGAGTTTSQHDFECLIKQKRDKRSAEDIARAVAQEYGELRNAFQRAAHCGEHEGFCHYKFKDYSRRARELALGAAELRAWWIFGFIAILSALAWPILFLQGKWYSWVCLSPLILFGVGFLRRWGIRMSPVILRDIAWDLFVLKWAGGYLVYLRSILLTGIAWIVGFAVFNAIVVACCHDLGHDIQRSGESIWPCGIDRFELAIRFFYYSTVTFTTLGYGDYVPHGPLLQLASALEALLGAVTISLITVVLARKFMR